MVTATKLKVERDTPRYTRADFAALRARLNKIATPTIMRLYYSEDLLYELKCEEPSALERRIDELRERLVYKLGSTSPHLSQALGDARKFNSWPKTLVDYLVQAAEEKDHRPKLGDVIDLWLKPRFARALKAVGVKTLSQLKDLMQTGEGWFKPVPRIGERKAHLLERWFRTQAGLGGLNIPAEARHPSSRVLTDSSVLTPIDQISSIAAPLDGSSGVNRNASFCLITARNDLEAVQAYLYKFRSQPKTYQAYRKELERFLLWCVKEKRVALSSVLTVECEAYKDFLQSIPGPWIGRPAPQSSSRWRPFNVQLSPKSQRYAIVAVRAFFEWLVKVRYLAGNPWVTVALPAIAIDMLPMAIHKAIPREIWLRLIGEGGYLDHATQPVVSGSKTNLRGSAVRAQQYRLAKAAILLLGTSGLRRAEACGATRSQLKEVMTSKGSKLWELAVLGKGNKWRTVYLPARTVAAIEEHWNDREHDFSQADSELHLLSVVSPAPAKAAQKKHLLADGPGLTGAGLTPTTLYRVLLKALKWLEKDVELTDGDATVLKAVTPHSLRHTFATHTVGAETPMPLDVLQKLMGHQSIHTTSIYIQAEKARTIEAVDNFFNQR